MPGYNYYSEKKLLKEMKIHLELSNSQIVNEVNYSIIAETTYEVSGWITSSTEYYTLTRIGILSNSRILESIRPTFTIEQGSAPVGSITFETLP